MFSYGRSLVIIVLARLWITLLHLKVASEFFKNEFILQMAWIKLFVFYYLRNKWSRIWFIYESKYKRSDPWILPLKTEKMLFLVADSFLKPFILFEDNANLSTPKLCNIF